MAPPRLFGMRRVVAVAATTVLTTLAFTGPVQAQTPPPPLEAPADLRLEPGSPTRATSITARWTVPASVPGDATVHWALCNDGDIAYPPGYPNGCGDRNRVSESRTSVTIPTPDEFGGTLWVWFEDADEREGLASRVAVVIDRTAPGAPTDVEWVDGIVRWTPPQPSSMFLVPESRVHWKLCRGWTGFAEDCVTGEGPAEPFALPAAMQMPVTVLPASPQYSCVGRQWSLWLWLEDAAGNVDFAPSNAGGIGGAVTPGCVPNQEDAPPTPRTKTKLTLGGRLTSTGKGSERRKRLKVTATVKPGTTGGTVRLRVTGKHGKRKLDRTRNVRLANGRASFTLTVPKGFRRLSVKATYSGSETHAPSSRRSTVELPR